jgi:SAM-dependent methyltransferase
MLEGELRARHDDVVAHFGPWIGYNIDLGLGVWTMAPGLVGMAEERVKQIVQLVTDFTRQPLSELRILDLGAHEGGFAIELARRGAEVVALEPRESHLAKAKFVKEALGLERLTIVAGNARDVATLVTGEFDVVLCLGLLYHLDGPGACELVHRLRRKTKLFTILETQISLTDRETINYDGHTYRGRPSPERPAAAGAAVDITTAFWLTRASLLNLLSDAGFTSVLDCANPVIPDLAAFRDHVTLIAAPGAPVSYLGLPETRWPEHLAPVAAPTQGLRWALIERRRRRHGGGMASVFIKRQRLNSE